MLDLTLFRNRTYAGANLVMLLVALAMFGVFFFVSLYMQNVLGYSAVQAGAAFLPMTILIILVAPPAGRLSDRWGSRGLMAGGMLLVVVQLAYFSQLSSDATFWPLLPGLVIGGFGMAMTMTPSSAAAMRAVPVEKAGVGSAVLNAFRQVGGSTGIALMGAIMASPARDSADDRVVHARLRTGAARRAGDRARRLRRRRLADPAARTEAAERRAARGALRRGGVTMTIREAARRLPAAERRRAIVRAALRVFSSTSYAGATTAEIAREAGVSEPVLYRHFASKRDLWIACLDVAWEETRRRLAGKIALFTGGTPPAGQQSPWRSPTMPNLWIQGLTEAGEDPVVRREIRRHMREVHDFVAAALRDGQARGAVPADRDPDAEAWVFIGGGLLRSVADRLGGVLSAATSRRSPTSGSAG